MSRTNIHQVLTEADRAVLHEAGLDLGEAERQLRILRGGRRHTTLDRPCGLGDGIRRLDERAREQALTAYRKAAQASRLGKFVPASGAATRMFRDLEAQPSGPRDTASSPTALSVFLEGLPRLPFADQLERFLHLDEGLEEPRNIDRLLRYLLTPEGLDFARRPKGLIPFHRDSHGSRTAFEEHLHEGAALAAGAGVQLHFTVAEASSETFERHLEEVRTKLGAEVSAGLEVTFSCQSSATNTLAIEADGSPFRGADGRLLLRPGGHGSLLRNLESTGGDLVLLKTIDNIQPQPAEETHRWLKILLGELARLQDEAGALLERLLSTPSDRATTHSVLRFLATTFGATPRSGEEPAAFARRGLERPIRVCGMVRNEGHPGGGPFWVRHEDGSTSPQIVETSQIDPQAPEQKALLERSTHFNPVALACGLRDTRGRPHQLADFVDPTASFIVDKTYEGRALRGLEHPGLWNGAMAGWNSLFVEMPVSTFSPVKTVLDLLTPAHQRRATGAPEPKRTSSP